jgi:hypothetical protein
MTKINPIKANEVKPDHEILAPWVVAEGYGVVLKPHVVKQVIEISDGESQGLVFRLENGALFATTPPTLLLQIEEEE